MMFRSKPYTLHHIQPTWEVARIAPLAHLVPDADYYVTPIMLERLRGAERSLGRRLFTEHGDTDPTRRWRGEDLNGKNVAYLATGHMGDALCHTAAYRQLSWDYPQIRLTAYAEYPEQGLLDGNADLLGAQGRLYSFALSVQDVMAYDYWIIPQPLPMLRRHRDTNYYTSLGEAVGVEIVKPWPYAHVSEQSRRGLSEYLYEESGGEITDSTPIIVMQVTSTEPSRTPGQLYERIAALSARIGNGWIVVVGHVEGAIDLMIRQSAEPIHHAIYALSTDQRGYQQLSPQALLALAQRARLVISPDSFMMHAAAAFDTPCLALWRTEDLQDCPAPIPPPESRIATYKACAAIPMEQPIDTFVRAALHMLRY